MKQKFLLLILFSISLSFTNAQITVDFEDAMLGDTNFVAGGFPFVLDGDFLISEFEDFSCDATTGLNRYMDSGYLDGASGIELGTILPANPVVVFQLSTSISQCAYIAREDGELLSAGTIKFIGTKTDATTIEEDFEFETTDFDELLPFTFSEAIWNGVDLKSLEIEIVSTQDATDYFALDNLVFETIQDPTSTNTINGKTIEVFPNPTKGILNVKGIQADRIQIMDVFGRVLKTEIRPNERIDISELPIGVYFLRLEADNQFAISKISKN